MGNNAWSEHPGVSIRTPVKGVISSCYGNHSGPSVSIRTPVKGVMSPGDRETIKSRFNPHPREGGDLLLLPTVHKHIWFQSAPP